METIETAFDKTRALVFGVGGRGDIVSTIPTARFLESQGVDVILGGVAWERVVVDPQPGPQHFDEIENINRLNKTVALATGETRTHDGIEFAETNVARHYDEDVLLIDIGGGVRSVELMPASIVTFYLDPDAIAATSDLDEYVRDTDSFDAAHKALSEAGYETELDLERRLVAGNQE